MTTSTTNAGFSIIRGGLLDRVLTVLRIIKPSGTNNLARKILFFILITWLPLLVLSILDGLFLGQRVQVPFLYDFPAHIRFLVAIPMLLMAEIIVDERVKLIVNQFSTSGLLYEDGREDFEKAKQKTDRMVETPWAEGIILLLIVANLVFRWVAHDVNISSWQFPRISSDTAISRAGFWAIAVAMPLFQFIILRWLWRWIIWFRLLQLISKTKLNLNPTHPDKAGGIGFLGEPPAPFSSITMTFGIVISAIIASRVLFYKENLADYYFVIGIFIVICILINILPLLIYFKILRITRIKGIFEYSALIHRHHVQFKEKWFKTPSTDELLIGNPDISSMCDFTPVYESIENMHPFPFDLKIMLSTIVISLLPLLPLIALVMPITDLLKVLAGLLF